MVALEATPKVVPRLRQRRESPVSPTVVGLWGTPGKPYSTESPQGCRRLVRYAEVADAGDALQTVAQDEDWDEDPHPSSAFTLVDPTRLRSCRSLARGHRGSN
jgi:hypothetical protein